jgi:phosphoketolase
MSDTAVVRFPVDANSAMACLADTQQRRGELHALVVAKGDLPVQLSREQALQLVADGALLVAGTADAPLQLVAIGAYQLGECRKAWQRLQALGVPTSLIALLEPARFRIPRDGAEAAILAPEPVRLALFGNPQ